MKAKQHFPSGDRVLCNGICPGFVLFCSKSDGKSRRDYCDRDFKQRGSGNNLVFSHDIFCFQVTNLHVFLSEQCGAYRLSIPYNLHPLTLAKTHVEIMHWGEKSLEVYQYCQIRPAEQSLFKMLLLAR